MNHKHQDLASEKRAVAISTLQPFEIVTLLDMNSFNAHLFFEATDAISREICKIETAIKERSPESPLTNVEYSGLTWTLKFLDTEATELGFEQVTKRIMEFEFSLLDNRIFPALSIILHDLKSVQLAITHDLSARTFMFLRPDDLKHYNQQQLFGPEVFKNFPSARQDVAEAGNCYATGRYTACVFHSTRVAENGLQTLAVNLNSRFGADVSFGDKDIRFANWGNILEKIETEIRKLLNPGRKPRLLREDLDFYSSAAKEFAYIKILWRDPVSHSGSEYDEPMAQSVMNHVKLFMNNLAENGLMEALITTDNKSV